MSVSLFSPFPCLHLADFYSLPYILGFPLINILLKIARSSDFYGKLSYLNAPFCLLILGPAAFSAIFFNCQHHNLDRSYPGLMGMKRKGSTVYLGLKVL